MSKIDIATSQLKATYKAAGQDHVFEFWDDLDASQKDQLWEQLNRIDITRVNALYKFAKESKDAFTSTTQDINPLPTDSFDTILDESASKATSWRDVGLDAIAKGHVGILLMAGGQGTRLGSTAPKGCYDIGLPSHKSLFQYQAERIKRLQTVAAEERSVHSGVVLPWYIMTSGPTRLETVNFFEKNNYFGLDPTQVIFFEQGVLPCLMASGEVILDTPSHIAMAPDGNGGIYAALRDCPIDPKTPTKTVITDLVERGILYLHAYCVDNCLVRVADPVFMGYCISKQAECAAKVVRKTEPSESVGVVARKGDKFSVVEYSELNAEAKERRDLIGQLVFRAANIANHFYTTEFLKDRVPTFEAEMAFHIADKCIPYIQRAKDGSNKPVLITPKDASGKKIENGRKLELFVFDVFPYSERFSVLEVDRKEEFSPLKNAPGTKSDNPETSRRDLLAQQKRFLEAAGAQVADGVEIEVSPLVSYAGEGLETVKGKIFSRSGIVESIEGFDALV